MKPWSKEDGQDRRLLLWLVPRLIFGTLLVFIVFGTAVALRNGWLRWLVPEDKQVVVADAGEPSPPTNAPLPAPDDGGGGSPSPPDDEAKDPSPQPPPSAPLPRNNDSEDNAQGTLIDTQLAVHLRELFGLQLPVNTDANVAVTVSDTEIQANTQVRVAVPAAGLDVSLGVDVGLTSLAPAPATEDEQVPGLGPDSTDAPALSIP